MWSAKLVDHMSGLLCKLAVLADSDSQPSEVEQEDSENKHIEQAQ